MSESTAELQTERLTLRQVRAGDMGAIRSYRSLPEVARFQSWVSFDEADALCLVEEQNGLAPDTAGTWFQLVILDRTSLSVIGDLALHFHEDDHRQVEIGINVAPDEQGKGYAAEAIRCVLGYLFEQLGKHRVVAITGTANVAAARLFRSVGFRQEGHFLEHVWFKGSYGSEYLFALLGGEWSNSLT
jgi:RimJ/RimL family protein N-acetyltransferase